MKRIYLGEFEEIVLLTVALLFEQAYGVAITEEIGQTSRSVSISAVHATLNRLEEKGLVNSYMAGATAERGGRRKRFFRITPAGNKALHDTREVRNDLWRKIPPHALQWKIN